MCDKGKDRGTREMRGRDSPLLPFFFKSLNASYTVCLNYGPIEWIYACVMTL